MITRNILLAAIMIILAATASGAAVLSETPPGGTVLAKVPFKRGNNRIDASGRKVLDAVLPEILKQGKDTFICLQGHAGTGRNRNEYIKRSLNLSKEVEGYLRLEKSVSTELYLATQDDKLPPRGGDYVNVIIFPAEFKEQSGFTQVISR